MSYPLPTEAYGATRSAMAACRRLHTSIYSVQHLLIVTQMLVEYQSPIRGPLGIITTMIDL